MIKETKGSLLEASVEALVNAVNIVGVMGKGIALQFRRKFSEKYFDDYNQACKNGELTIGKVHIYQIRSSGNPRYIINFPTKKQWREKSRLEDIENGLKSLVETIEKHNIKSVAVPALGCGLGGLEWDKVRPLIENSFAQIPHVEILLYVPISK